ncbi:MAG TPA: 50S ribosomal protein L29 [Candidatus Acidoferrum sp.]|nr:50S ribosomal protein L29 [Candidatus Acidoferrum sp.]
MSKLAKDILKLSPAELSQKIDELRKELVEQKRSRQSGELMNTYATKKTRRSIAIALTGLSQSNKEVETTKEAK